MIPIVASIGAKIAGWVSPWIIAGVLAAALAGLWIWDAKTIDSLTAQRDAALESINGPDGYKVRAAATSAALVQHQKIIEERNAEVEQRRADLAKTEAILDTADTLNRLVTADLEAEIAKLKERARANPDQTCRLGPIVRDVRGLLNGRP